MQTELAARTKVGLVSLGCAKNRVDAEIMLGILADAGYEITNEAETADVIIVNTCTFIEPATEESIDSVLEMGSFKKNGRCKVLILSGCMGTRYKDELLQEFPEVDAVVGVNEVPEIAGVVEKCLAGQRFTSVSHAAFLYDENAARILSTKSQTAYVKIAEGCNHSCAFCVIPSIRGAYRSRTVESVTAEVKRLIGNGVKEIVLIAQDTTAYGIDLYGKPELAKLLDSVAGVEGLAWLRLLYAYPTNLSDEVLTAMAHHHNIVKYVELPLQHVSDPVLKAMRRPGSMDATRRLVEKIRATIPGVVLRTSFIVGFPGETEEDFLRLVGFVEEQGFDHVGVFTYWPEEGSLAASLPNQVDQAVKEERQRALMEVQRSISRRKNELLLGKRLQLLVEGHAEQGGLLARAKRQAPEVDGLTYIRQGTAEPGDLVTGRIIEALDYDLVAEI